MKNIFFSPQRVIAFLFSIAILLFSLSSIAQDEKEELKLSIQLRPRAEIRNGLFTPILEGQKPAAFIAQRSRLGVYYDKEKKLQIGLSAQVVNTWGNDPQVQPTANDLSLYEAWARFYFNDHWSVKAGRQVLAYDDERILGSLDWNNAGRKHDAALVAFEKNKFQGNAVFAFSQNSEKVTNTFFDNSYSQPYKAMEFLWMKYGFSNSFSASVLLMNLDIQNKIDSSIRHLQTLGGNLYYKKNKLDLKGTYYYQLGNIPSQSSATKTRAWMASVKADYHVNSNVSFGAGSDYLSGRDMNSSSTTLNYFDPLYGTHHKFYGYMDYFYAGSGNSNAGLWDSYLDLNVNTSKKFGLQLVLHHFEAAARVIDYSGNTASSSLGNEADITFNYKIMSDVKLSGGYSQMFTDPSMRYVKQIDPAKEMQSIQNWVWLSVNVNPSVILHKSK